MQSPSPPAAATVPTATVAARQEALRRLLTLLGTGGSLAAEFALADGDFVPYRDTDFAEQVACVRGAAVGGGGR